MSVALLDPEGDAWAWAGRHRLPPAAEGDSIGSRATGYYVVLEARRHSADGRTAVAGRAGLGPPRGARPLAQPRGAVPRAHRGRAHGVPAGHRARQRGRLRLRGADDRRAAAAVQRAAGPAGAGNRQAARLRRREPDRDLADPARHGPRPVAHRAGRSSDSRCSAACSGSRCARRSAARSALQPFFSPATFFRPLLGPLSGSAGALALAGALLTIAGVWLWRRRLPRRWYGRGARHRAAPGRRPISSAASAAGITPPAGGVSVGLWLSWHLAILVSAAALHRAHARRSSGADGPRPRSARRIAAGVAIAVAAATVGVLVWSPRGGWPDWYTFLWTPALLLVALPAPRWADDQRHRAGGRQLGRAGDLGRRARRARSRSPQRDIARLGDEPDPLAVPLLERFGEQVLRAPAADDRPPRCTRSGTARRWATRAIPAHLALWSSAGALLDELPLDSLDLPPSLLSTMVRELGADESQRVAQISRVPGVHYVLHGAGQPG